MVSHGIEQPKQVSDPSTSGLKPVACFGGQLLWEIFIVPPPRPFEHFPWNHQVPFRHEATGCPLGAVQIMRLPGPQIVKRLEVTVLHHQRFAVLFEKEPHLRPGGRVSEQERT